MYILLTDETNRTHAHDATFFVYGGLIVSLDKVSDLHRAIKEIREVNGYKPEDKLKFETRSRPEYVSRGSATTAKQQVVAACVDAGCKFIAYVVHHQIARNQPVEQVVEWGADHVIGKFNHFLASQQAQGIVAMDRLPNGAEFDYLSHKFTNGLSFQDGEDVELDHVALFSSTCINASHLSSAMDIVLGSWRYCINAPKNVDAAKQMMKEITKLIWCRKVGETLHVAEMGLVLRPKDIKVPQYKADYEGLLKSINELLADA